jgi:hypothetical protein
MRWSAPGGNKMAEVDVDDWLEEWVNENMQTPVFQENKSAMAHDAATCRRDAESAGILMNDLDAAAGGDLEEYLLRQQNALTNAEVQRKVASDKY